MYTLSPFERRSLDLFNAFHDYEDNFFKSTPTTTFKTDIRDDGDKYVLEAELPGFEKGDITLDVTGDNLVLTAKHSTEKVDKDKANNYICRERSYGSYQRSFDISSIDADKIEAEYKNGILCMVMPKKTATAPETRRLEIK
jgi:HSP20 family protein